MAGATSTSFWTRRLFGRCSELLHTAQPELPWWLKCPYCHRRLPSPFYLFHRKQHIRRRADGQMRDHITLPAAKRAAQSLEGVPRVYTHPKCGARTGMPEEIIRSYLADPFLYADRTYCCGCQTYVPETELSWIETGENLGAYKKRLQDAARAGREN